MRDFRPSDQEAVQRLILDGLRERWGAAFDDSLNSDLDDIAASYVDCGADVVVVDTDTGIVATGVLLSEWDQRARIVRMSVASTHRRQGFGRMVVEELISRARKRGVPEIVVLTDTPWTSAVELYLACGFSEVDRDDTDTHFAMAL